MEELPQKKMLQENARDEEIKIYELLCQRIMKAYDQMSSHFSLYLSFNTGGLVVFGFLVQPHLGGKEVPSLLVQILSVVCFFGFLFTLAWLFIMRDDRRWQLLINKVLGNVERHIFEDKESALYTKINEEYSPETKPLRDWRQPDATDINIVTPAIFLFIWAFLFIFVFRSLPTSPS